MILQALSWIASADAQTVAQSERSLDYLSKLVCVEPDGAGGHDHAGGVRVPCRADAECAQGTCEHESLVVAAATL